MDVLAAIDRRRMRRAFRAEPVADDTLRAVVRAGTRAPSGANRLLRRLIVVTDSRLVRTVRQVTPSLLADAPAVVAICTDVARAEAQTGPLGRDVSSLIDVGAAAQNMALAAVALGLGTCFARSSNAAALREVLELPPHLRPDLLVAVGHPAPEPTPEVKAPRPIVDLDRFGTPWEAMA